MRAAFALLCALAGTSAFAQTELRVEDAARLARFHQVAGDALLRAFATGSAADTAALSRALSGTPQVAFDESLGGDWKCRTLKLGGVAGLAAYAPFDCRFTFQGDSYLFEKLSGSQRTKGTVSFREGRAVYVGVGHVAGQTPPLYSDLPPDFRSDGNTQSDVALFERISPTRARLLFPAPATESDFDILELTR